MAQILVTYKTPKDPGAFDAYYFNRHVPIAKKIPGLKKYIVNNGPVASPAGTSGIHLVAILEFENLAAVQNAFASPEGQAAAADLPNFATGGVDLYFYDTCEV
jgi:uncharacterized protein (TIGR02118 family)